MASDISRRIFNPRKHYSGVLMQQGRVQLDSDWNEQLDLRLHRTHVETRDVIGNHGVPKKGNSFKITPTPNGFAIGNGHIYVGGLLCKLDTTASYLNQPYYPDPLNPFVPIGSPPTSPPSSPPTGQLAGTCIVFIDAWQREVNYLDDPIIQEVALGEADTTTRLQNVWQVKILKTDVGGADCESDIPEWDDQIAPSSGTLNVQATQLEVTDNPCFLAPSAGYGRVENQLYRIEVQHGGDEAQATFKWSRDNASVETKIIELSGSIVRVEEIGKDEILGFTAGDWVEIVNEESSLNGIPYPLVQIQSVDASRREIELASAPLVSNGQLKLRRWDQHGATATANGIALTSGWMDLEGGIQVEFSPGTYKAGDYWLVPARTATGEVEWPPFEIPNTSPLPQAPAGMRHHYCKLAIVQIENGAITQVEDCRPLFPSLSEICAEDICYSNEGCTESTATTVQEALDELCHKRDGSCTYHVFPRAGWENVFDKIKAGADAQICFQIGDYPLNNSVLISGKGNLKLVGAGAGTRILASKTEAALVFDQCQSVVASDIYASTASFLSQSPADTTHLNGVFSFHNCQQVELSSLVIKCGAAAKKQVTCITVRNDATISCSVSVDHCNLQIGHYQQGILLVNAARSLIQNNKLTTYDSFSRIEKTALLSDKKYLANARSTLVSNASIREPVNVAPRTATVTLTASGQTINFATDTIVKNDWNRLLAENPGENINSANDLLMHVKGLANRVLLDRDFAETIPAFRVLRNGILTQTRSIASKGIVVGGTVANEVRILNNSINGALAGIHVGLSQHAARTVHDQAETVNLTGNSLEVVLPRDSGKIERHGIFVGNCRSLLIEDNNLRIERLAGAENIPVDGIKIWGMLGERVMVAKNVVCSKDGNRRNSFSTAIRINPLATKSSFQQWTAIYNVAQGTISNIIANKGASAINNTP